MTHTISTVSLEKSPVSHGQVYNDQHQSTKSLEEELVYYAVRHGLDTFFTREIVKELRLRHNTNRAWAKRKSDQFWATYGQDEA